MEALTPKELEQLRIFRNDLRIETTAQPLRNLLASMRQIQGDSDYFRGYADALEFTLNLLQINHE